MQVVHALDARKVPQGIPDLPQAMPRGTPSSDRLKAWRKDPRSPDDYGRDRKADHRIDPSRPGP